MPTVRKAGTCPPHANGDLVSCDGALFWCDLPLELRDFPPNNQVGKDTRAGVGAKSGTRGNYPNLGCIIMIAAVHSKLYDRHTVFS